MLRTKNEKTRQISLIEAYLPKELLELDGELKKVDELLNDERFLEPFLARANTKTGRPTIPVEVFLRLMYLKARYQLGYEALVKEVSDSIKWRRFCHLTLDERVPDPSTLIKTRQRFGEQVLKELNDALVKKLKEEKVIRSKKIRVDTTVVEANIHYPTDAGLLADGVKILTRTVKKIKERGIAGKEKFRVRLRSVKRRLLKISKFLKNKKENVVSQIDQVTKEIAGITEKVVEEARSVKEVLYRELSRSGQKVNGGLKKLNEKFTEQIDLVEKVLDQARKVISGNRKIADRIVSLHDPGARPIRKGKLKSPTEFGRKLLLTETQEGIITDYQVFEGNPPDKKLLLPTVKTHTRLTGKPPWGVAADRGFYSSTNEKKLRKLGVSRISLPQPGKKTKARILYEKQSFFVRLKRWRSAGEATIAHLKRKFGLHRSLFRGNQGTREWVGMGILARNLWKAASLMG